MKEYFFPAPPKIICALVEKVQIERLRRQVPFLYAVGAFNILIIIIALSQQGISLAALTVPVILILFCLFRILIWMRRDPAAIEAANYARIINRVTVAAFLGVNLASAWCIWSLLSSTVVYPVLGPVSLALGMLCVAHCLATIREAAVISLIFGIVPSSLVMITLSDAVSVILGITFISATLLQIRLVNEQYSVMVKGLLLEHQIRDQANTDALTQLPNRRAFMAKLETYVEGGEDFGIALLDLDGFKQVNDRLGHLAGDILLQHVGQRLMLHSEQGDYSGRLGGDEFILLFPHCHSEAIVSAKATAILATLCQPVDSEGQNIPVAASLGYALFPRDGTTSAAILAAADTALYAAKQAGKAQVAGYKMPKPERLVA